MVARTYGSSGSSDDLGKLILRVVLAVLLLFHGVSKIFGGVGFITGMLAKAGLPAELGYLVYVGEVIAPLLILFGVWTRPAALVVAINMVVAILLVHTGELFSMTKTGGWALELQGFYLASAIAVALLGAGRYSVAGASGRWN
ncbi:MAG TPA: DoxX family protein [Noviherbaspirillum sp.]|jgi:putative oxidoreductase|uniref:DoxX family protein n=1 Tax=Noviherbaspirillum sp. TaxID=1926288 RepID=UPI002DDD60DD|nr:DoxX family protein [Noviherbaspirillum sp.]HEV2610777.1 DoxX family protein [Noviherbaspirillum sp.]